MTQAWDIFIEWPKIVITPFTEKVTPLKIIILIVSNTKRINGTFSMAGCKKTSGPLRLCTDKNHRKIWRNCLSFSHDFLAIFVSVYVYMQGCKCQNESGGARLSKPWLLCGRGRSECRRHESERHRREAILGWYGGMPPRNFLKNWSLLEHSGAIWELICRKFHSKFSMNFRPIYWFDAHV